MKLQADIEEHKRATATALRPAARTAPAPAPRAYAPSQMVAPQQPYAAPMAMGTAAGWAQADATNGWGEYRDPTSAHIYFYNSRTGESSWVRPPELAPATQAGKKAHPRVSGGVNVGGGTTNPNKGPPGANLFIARAMRRGDVDLYDSAQLRATFEPYGRLLRAEMSVDKETGANKGFGFVSFAEVDAADRAIAFLQGQVIAGKPLRIEKTKEDGGIHSQPGQPPPPAATVGGGGGILGVIPPAVPPAMPAMVPGGMVPPMGGYAQALMGGGVGWGAYGAAPIPPSAGIYGGHVGGAYPPRY